MVFCPPSSFFTVQRAISGQEAYLSLNISPKMTAEMHKLANDPNFVVQFAIGEPLPNLITQSKDSGIRMSGVYFDTTKRYIMKHAHMSKEDVSTHHFIF